MNVHVLSCFGRIQHEARALQDPMSFEAELKNRTKKLEKEQEQRRILAKEKLERNLRVQEESRARKLGIEESQRRKRLEDKAREEEERLCRESQAICNRGVSYEEDLLSIPLDGELASKKGIRRCNDKVLLPPSAKRELLRHGVDKLGSLLFEITSFDGSRTHVGLLDFTAPEGMVCIPRGVMKCLGNEQDTGYNRKVRVRYVRLPGGKSARLQPMEKAFHQEEDIKLGLEAALLTRCTLTEGDIITALCGTKQHELQVLHLEPRGAVSIVETDLEVDIAPSVETEDEINRLEEARRIRRDQVMKEVEQEKQRLQQEEMEDKLRREVEEAQQKDREQRWARLSNALPAEPAPGSGVTNILIRAPDGHRRERRFMHSDAFSLLFDFIDSGPCGGAEPGSYRLVMLYPKRVFTKQKDGGITLEEAGIKGKQESLLVELVDERG